MIVLTMIYLCMVVKTQRPHSLIVWQKREYSFTRAYLAEAMCQPCRAELYTGQYPLRNGCAWNHSSSRRALKALLIISEQKYRVGLSGKVHVKPKDVYPFEKVEGFDVNCVRSPTRDHNLKGIKKIHG